MEGLENMWSRFSLNEEEKSGAEVSKDDVKEINRLAGRFFTKRVLNVEAVGRTFKPLWKLKGEVKIRDLGDNILIFDFEEGLDMERVLDLEPWSYDKYMVAFERVSEIENVPLLEFNRVNFWVQIHNVPERSLTQATSESVGKTIGKVLEVADPEDDGASNEFLRVRVSIDISKPLPRCRKLWAEGASRSQAPWWRKPGSKVHFPTSQPDNAPVRVEGNENGVVAASPMTIERNVKGLKIYNEDGLFVRKKNKETCAKTSPCKVNVGSHANSPSPMPLGDCSNLASPLVPAQ
nr:hypothetical protein CFP56_46295 [Quercus suber]